MKTIFGKTSEGKLTLELWTVLPFTFLFSFIILAIPEYDLNTSLILDLIFTGLIGIVYFYNFLYKKLRVRNDKA